MAVTTRSQFKHRRLKAAKLFGFFIAGLLPLFLGGFLIFDVLNQPNDYSVPIYGREEAMVVGAEMEKTVKHLAAPEPLKAVYMTSCAAATPSFREPLLKLIETTELNAIVIDIKDFSGTLSYKPKDESLLHGWQAARCGVLNMPEFINNLHDREIYVIGRVTVFQDPHLAKLKPEVAVKFASTGEIWRDRKGLNFTDPGAREVWDYHVAIAKDAYSIGFDELNFDYIRFPSDGPMNDIHFPYSNQRPKPEVIESFFAYLAEQLKPTGMIISADLFGMTTTNTDDLNIGQVLERALPYFDYIAPMVYPSHYPPKFNGWPDPNAIPYDIVKYSMTEAVRRTMATSTTVAFSGAEAIASTTPQLYAKPAYSPLKLRPWLQDFDWPVEYDTADVQAQKQAVYDSGLTSWMLWDPANIYTRQALDKE